ncbi:MAG: tRNA (adenosine(37)-N6)-threonylcarbamoyltransferase complex transferase subunit TsaD [Bdellovibrionia bacterium]
MIKRVLAIETSCDDTSVAIVDHDGHVETLVSATRDLDHAPFGGIVPEIASRNHSLYLLPLVEEALNKKNYSWSDIDGIAVTNRPGLMGALIVGVITGKSLSQAYNLPFVGVNHLEGHLVAPLLKDETYTPPAEFAYPYLALAISGGHTSLYLVEDFAEYKLLGSTKDDAAGEAFDKFAKMAGLGFPGGVRVDQLARSGNRTAFEFPRSMIHDPTFDMSFSGLKASAQRLLEAMTSQEIEKNLPDLCASYQEAIVDVLIAKLDRAAKEFGLKRAILTGGVSANSRLRERADEWAQKRRITLISPPLRYCTDNAAMIGYAGILRLNRGEQSPLSLSPSPTPWENDFK